MTSLTLHFYINKYIFWPVICHTFFHHILAHSLGLGPYPPVLCHAPFAHEDQGYWTIQELNHVGREVDLTFISFFHGLLPEIYLPHWG